MGGVPHPKDVPRLGGFDGNEMALRMPACQPPLHTRLPGAHVKAIDGVGTELPEPTGVPVVGWILPQLLWPHPRTAERLVLCAPQ